MSINYVYKNDKMDPYILVLIGSTSFPSSSYSLLSLSSSKTTVSFPSSSSPSNMKAVRLYQQGHHSVLRHNLRSIAKSPGMDPQSYCLFCIHQIISKKVLLLLQVQLKVPISSHITPEASGHTVKLLMLILMLFGIWLQSRLYSLEKVTIWGHHHCGCC